MTLQTLSPRLTPPQVWAAGQHPMPFVSAYVLHTESPPQHTVLRPGPQLLAAGQQEVPAHATLLGHTCST